MLKIFVLDTYSMTNKNNRYTLKDTIEREYMQGMEYFYELFVDPPRGGPVIMNLSEKHLYI